MKTKVMTICVLVAMLAFGSAAIGASIVAWGKDLTDQCSDIPGGATTDGSRWYSTDNDFIDIAAGFEHSLALRADRSIDSWGWDGHGQVSNTPTGTGYTAIAAGFAHSLALTPDGLIVSWGRNTWGQVSSKPTGTGYTAIAGGVRNSLALAADGSIDSWGDDEWGQVSNKPTGTGYVAIGTNGYHSLALAADGSIVSWGNNEFGQCSDIPGGATTDGSRWYSTDNDFIDIPSGGDHSLAMRTDGSIVDWGSNVYGELTNTPTGTGYEAIAGGVAHSLALRADGSIVSWGSNVDNVVSDTPTGTGYTAISAGYHSLALTPEPATLGLLLFGGVVLLRRRSR